MLDGVGRASLQPAGAQLPSEETEDFKHVIKWKMSQITLKSYVACSLTQVLLTLTTKTTG